MPKKLTHMAIAYDFDGTLSPGNMQEYTFIPAIQKNIEQFWSEVGKLAKEKQADKILTYMKLMLEKAAHEKVSVRREDFARFGTGVKLFKGVTDWFGRINNYAREKNIVIEHYIISSGLKEMVEATKIGREFEAIFASSFMYDHHGIADWPALAINYTTKTQYLFRINKGTLDVNDDTGINEYVRPEDRPIPFERIIYLGDGSTDIPCMKLVKELGGHSIAVFKPHTKGARTEADQLIAQDRVNFIAPANYEDNRAVDRLVKSIIDKIVADTALK